MYNANFLLAATEHSACQNKNSVSCKHSLYYILNLMIIQMGSNQMCKRLTDIMKSKSNMQQRHLPVVLKGPLEKHTCMKTHTTKSKEDITVKFAMCVLKTVKTLCLWSTGLGTLALQVYVLVVVWTCEACCEGGYVTVVMIGCGSWRLDCMCVCCSRQVLTWLLMSYTCTQSTMYLISSHPTQRKQLDAWHQDKCVLA